MVTSHKMNENEMGYRGSKSLKSVKEQREDGSYFINKNKNLMKLRCTLMGREICYQIKIPSKQLIKNFSNYNYPPLLSCLCKALLSPTPCLSLAQQPPFLQRRGWRFAQRREGL